MDLIIWFILLAGGINAEELSHEILHSNHGSENGPILLDNPVPVMPMNKIYTSEAADVDTECDFPFERVGTMCYYFSDALLNYQDALSYCESLTFGHTNEISLAMLDYSIEQDQALLDAVVMKNETFWLGGASADDDTTWKWVDNRDIRLRVPFWDVFEPMKGNGTCIDTHSVHYPGNHYRSYIYAHNCEDTLPFICQSGPVNCPEPFQRIGDHCYMRSLDFGIPDLSFQDSRDYCSSLLVYPGYHVDLAMLGLPNQDDYEIMKSFIGEYSGALWLGVTQESQCNYTWIDGREVPLQSIYWRSGEPSCEDNHHASIQHINLHIRSYLISHHKNGAHPFICQMYQDN